MAEVECEVNEQKSAEESLQKANRKQHEESEQLKILEDEGKRKEEAQQLKMTEEEKKRRDENEWRKQMEQKQKSQEIQLLADNRELKQESQNSQQAEESHNNQHRAESLNNQEKQPKVKKLFDEESRLYEQLKVLQEQARKQKGNVQNQEVTKDTCLTVDNRISGNETSRHKCKEKATKESARQSHEQKQLEEEIKKQQQKVQEQNIVGTEKLENIEAHQNGVKTDGEQKQAKKTENKKMQDLSKQTEENAKQEQKDEMNKLLLMNKNKGTLLENLTRNKQLVVQKRNSPVEGSPEVTSQPNADHTEKSVKCENSQLTLQSEVNGLSHSNIVSQSQKTTDAKCQVNTNTSNEFTDGWEKTVEAKRLKWMRDCESWRYM